MISAALRLLFISGGRRENRKTIDKNTKQQVKADVDYASRLIRRATPEKMSEADIAELKSAIDRLKNSVSTI